MVYFTAPIDSAAANIAGLAKYKPNPAEIAMPIPINEPRIAIAVPTATTITAPVDTVMVATVPMPTNEIVITVPVDTVTVKTTGVAINPPRVANVEPTARVPIPNEVAITAPVAVKAAGTATKVAGTPTANRSTSILF